MTNDELIRFLLEDSKALHSNLQELHALMAQLVTLQSELTGDMKRLANIVTNHAQRLDGLEGRE